MPGPSLPTRFGRYELVDLLATGGMAEVFLARSFGVSGFRKHVVIKRLRPGLAHAPHFVQLFVQEARLSAGLSHPNVVQIHELGAAPGPGGEVHYIAMEYIHGHDLTHLRRALAADRRTLAPGLAVHAVAGVLRALAYAHGRTRPDGQPLGIVHRDVSPHNVLVSFQGEVKLVDFGIARVEGEAQGQAGGEERGRGMPGGGKYAYMSPEQATGRDVDGRSDVFSAGIVLWELLVGRRLFQHPDPAEKLRRVRHAEVPDPRTLVEGVPDRLWTVLQAMLARAPEDRPTAREAEALLQEVRYAEGLRGDGSSLGAVLRDLFPERARRDPGGLDLAGLAADLSALERQRLSEQRRPGEPPPGGRAAEPGGDTFGTARYGSADDETEEGTGSLSHATRAAADAHTALPALRGLAPGERKTVVVVTGELTGLTGPSAHQDPERIVRTHYRLLRRIRRVVDRHGGVLDRFHDDRFTIFFGLPRTTEHDIDRALACAAQLVRLGRRLGTEVAPVAISVGVHQGEVALGRLDARELPRRLRYLSRGDTTKLAGRLAGAADLHEVLVSERVAALARQRFRFVDGPPLRRRGGAAPLQTRRLVGRETGVRASAGRWLPRADELERVGRALRRVAGGERVVLAIRGPAGSGKSRLLQELRDLARARGVPVYGARAVPYAADRPLATLRDVVARVLGIGLDPSRAEVEEALARLRELGLPGADVEAIAGLFGQRRGSAPAEEVPGAAGRFVRAVASVGPVLLAVEDAQHLSELEQGVLRQVLAATEGVPVLLLLTVRGEPPPGLGDVDDEIDLGTLSPDLQRAFVAQLLGVREVSDALFERVAAAAEGNPRYIEEVTKALRGAGAIAVHAGPARGGGEASRADVRDDVEPALPVGLEGLIRARIDALPDALRQVLQVAAVVGPTFSVGLLEEACGGGSVAPLLAELEDQGLVQQEEGRTAFASQLVWEVVEGSVLAARRRELHGLVADALERRRGEGGVAGPRLSSLAAHAAAAGRPLDAARAGCAAGEWLRRQQALPAAVRQWEQALSWLQEAADAGASPAACLSGEALLHWHLGSTRTLLGQPRRALRHLRAAQDAAAECEDAEIEARATLDLARLHRDRADHRRARTLLESALAFARGPTGGDEATGWRREVAVEALEALGALHRDAGDEEAAAACFAEALDRAGEDEALAARALLGQATRRIRRGEEGPALELLARARDLAEASGDRILLGRVVNNTGLVHHGAGRLAEALACFEEARRIREDTGYRQGEAINLHNVGDTLARMGQDARAWAAFEESRALARSMGWTRGEVMNDVWLAWLEARRSGGDLDELRAAIDRAAELDDGDTALTGRWLLGRLLAERGQPGEARDVLRAALDAARAGGAGTLAGQVRAALDDLPA